MAAVRPSLLQNN